MAQRPGPFHRCTPGPPLSEFVDFFWSYERYAPAHRLERLLPTGTSELVFSVDASGRAASGVSGVRSTSHLLDTSTPFSVIAVHFRPGGGFPFFGVPGTELHNQSVTLDLLWGRDAASVRDRLWEADSAEERFKVLEEALRMAARGCFERHPAVRYALDAFDRSNGARPVGGVIERIGLSARRFGDLFRAEVGLSPKAFCRIRRFNTVLTRIERLTDVDWTGVALSCGYFDQAHFNHDFRAFAGLTPSAYLRDRMSRTHVLVSGAGRDVPVDIEPTTRSNEAVK
jgi:AraC-like DNA-binding protein